MICHPNIVKILEELGLSSKIPCQKDVLIAGGTDAGAIHVSRGGVQTGGISIPCRYIHSPVEMVSLEDVSSAVRLMTAFAEKKLEITKDVM